MSIKKWFSTLVPIALTVATLLVTPVFAASDSGIASETSPMVSASNESQSGSHAILIPVKMKGLDATVLLTSSEGKEVQSVPMKAGEVRNITVKTDELSTFHYKVKLKEEDTKTASYDHTVYDIEAVSYIDEDGKWRYTVEASYNDGNKSVKPDVIEFENKAIKAPATPEETKPTSTTTEKNKPSSNTKSTSTNNKTTTSNKSSSKGNHTPKTGDPFFVSIYIGAMIISLGGIAFLLANKKTEKDD